MLGTHTNNYVLGRGELYFAQFAPGTATPGGERYIGNTPEFNMTLEEEELEHFNSDAGVREQDDSISLETTRSGSFVTDNIDPKNLALYFFGSHNIKVVTGATVNAEAHLNVEQGLYYQLGTGANNPAGVRGLALWSTGPNVNVLVQDDADVVTYIEGTDYEVDMTLARIYIIPGGNITDGDEIHVSYKTATKNRAQVISGSSAIQGALRFVAVNPKGDNVDFYMPKVSVSPNGDYNLKGEEWQQIPFSVKILKKAGQEAIYADGRPYNP